MKPRLFGKPAISAALACVASAMVLFPVTSLANLVVDGGFEAGTVADGSYQTYTAGTAMGGWTVTSGSVDLIRGYWQPPEGSQSVDMAGLYANGTIQQTISGLTIGATYHLSFDMAGNPDDNINGNTLKTLLVTFGSSSQTFTFDTTGKTHNNMGWLTKSADFVAGASSVLLSFQDLSTPPGTAFGSAIDNVSLVPEPTTMIAGALLLLPFGLSTIRILRKRHAA